MIFGKTKKDQAWRRKIPEIRKAKLDWLLANMDLTGLDPYNPRDCDFAASKMVASGIIKPRSTCRLMISQSMEKLILQAQKIKGIRK